MPTMQCARCGRPNPGDARYCSNCGAPLVAGGTGGWPAGGGPAGGGGPGQGGPATPPRPGPGAPPRPGEITMTQIHQHDPDYGDYSYPDSASVGQLPPGTALLIVMRGPNAGSTFRLDSDLTTAGRHPDSDIFLDDVTVSRRHAEFYREAGGARFVVRDVGSLNGTYVNGSRIEEAELHGGDDVQIGKFRLQFLTGQDQWGRTLSGDQHGRGSQGYT
ncbi:MAG TPA: FHA domain-containing protein [Streptosporangiaceae bacterium]|nr:FHA domain-containing protein [Streptosporangiaceae bacterium]